MPDSHKKSYFTLLGSGIRCLKITHDKTLKECIDQFGSPTGDIINATNIIMSH